MKNIKIFGLSLIFTFCLGLDTGWCQSQKNYPPELESSSTEIYKTVGETKLRLWIYKPEGTVSEQPRSAIVFFLAEAGEVERRNNFTSTVATWPNKAWSQSRQTTES